MQHEEHNSADAIRLPGSYPDDSASKIQLSPNTIRRLERLAHRRIDPALIEFPEGAPRSEGKYGIVSRALLSSWLGAWMELLVWWICGTVMPNSGVRNLGDNGRQKAEESNDRAHHREEEGEEGLEQEYDDEASGWRKAVAVKKMKVEAERPDEVIGALSLMIREAEFLVRLSHENIIRLEGFVEDASKGMVWLVFLWEDNGDLKDFIASHNWEIPERLSLIYDVARGVEYLHSRNHPIVHGDLKSVNILVNANCRAVITDFGSAHHPVVKSPIEESERVITEPQPAPSLEATHCPWTNTITLTHNQYTLRWAAPELLNEEDGSLASDMWAFGCVAYEVMTESIPFQDVGDALVIKRVVRGDLPSISSDARMLLIQALCTLVRHCWIIDPSKRPTAEECRKEMEWMPMIVPNPAQTADTAGPMNYSPELMMKLGHMYLRQGDYSKASEYFTKALNASAEIADSEGRAKALVELALVHRLRSEYSEAVKLYSECLQIRTDIGDKRGRAEALWGLADVHRLRNEYSEAVTFYSECLQIRTDIGDKGGRAEALWGLADVHRLRDEHSEAVPFYSECLEIRTDIGDRGGRAEALWGLADVHRLRKEYNEAVRFYSECLEIRTDIGDRRGRASALWGLADVHRLRNEYNDAVRFYSECLHIWSDIGDRGAKASALWGLAEAYLLRKEYSVADPLYSECLQIWTDLGNRGNTSYALWGLASGHLSRKESSKALKLFSESLQISTDIGDREATASALWGLASAYRDLNEYTQAFHLYSECLQIRTDISDRRGRAEALCGLAQVHRLQNEYNRALTLCSLALEISTTIGDRYFRAFTLQCMAEVYRDQHDRSTAIHHYHQAAEIYNQIGHKMDEAAAVKEAAELRRSTARTPC